MKINLKIHTLMWEIHFKDFSSDFDPLDETQDNEQDLGITKRSCDTILINKSIGDDLLMRTIIHELTHAYFWSYGLTQIKNLTEENFADFMETHGRNILRDSEFIYNKYKGNSHDRK